MASITLANVGKIYKGGNRAVDDLNLDIADGEFMVFVGPSGCGKTTALRMVAGLEDISEGTISIGDRVVNEIDPGKRDIAMVFQNYALYPHMSIFENIAFPLRARRVPKAEVREKVERTAKLLGLTEFLPRKPRTLSGGQRQRVAMGRAIVREPQAFLMDEPLSNLDAKLRMQMRSEISNLQAEFGVTTIYVTHDQVEAMTMGSRIAVMRKGVLQQQGAPQDVYERPVNMFVAAFIGSPGMNFFRASLRADDRGHALELPGQSVRLPDDVVRERPALAGYADRDLAVGVRPEHLTLGGDGGPTMSATVLRSEMLGAERLVHIALAARPIVTDEVMEAAADVDPTTVAALADDSEERQVSMILRASPAAHVEAGSTVQIGLVAPHLHFFDLATGAVIVD